MEIVPAAATILPSKIVKDLPIFYLRAKFDSMGDFRKVITFFHSVILLLDDQVFVNLPNFFVGKNF